jgi:ABC-type Mn2+/Zn2+ transport system permease subunit
MIATNAAPKSNDDALNRLWNIFRVVGWIGAVVILLLPAVAMRFTDEVNWTAFDFVFAGVVLGGAGLILEVFARVTPKPAMRFGAALIVGLIVGLIWAWAVA